MTYPYTLTILRIEKMHSIGMESDTGLLKDIAVMVCKEILNGRFRILHLTQCPVHIKGVRHDAIDTLTPYNDDEPTKTIIGVHGAFHHVSETEDEIYDLITARTTGYER